MGKLIDMTGKKFERLTVLEMNGRQSGHVTWKCECDCGKIKIVRGVDLRNKNTASCGCYGKEITSKLSKGKSPEQRKLDKMERERQKIKA